jgi:3alpha(or 20beta)-hydroxysteroid dehydrogenase
MTESGDNVKDLFGRVAVVTGSSRNIGRAIALELAGAGAAVMVNARTSAAAAEAVADEIRKAGGRAAVKIADVADPGASAALIAAAVESFGRLDILVNNAAVLLMSAIADTTPEAFLRVVQVNQLGTFLGIKSVIEAMKAAGGGSIVNVASVDALRGQTGIVAYASSKWAVRGITRVAALELGRHGIRVNTVCPEAGSAQMIGPYMPPGVAAEKVIPRMQPALSYQKDRTLDELMLDVANAVLFLASDESRSCTGSDLVCEGGNTAGRIVKGVAGL